MTCTEWSQVLSAYATAAAALIALATTLINLHVIRKTGKEKHVAVKPIFLVNGHSENWIDYKLEFNITNFGFDKFQKVDAKFEGIDDVETKVVLNFNKTDNPNTDFIIRVNIKKRTFNVGELNCKLKLFYSNIYGKSYMESIDVIILTKYYEATCENSSNLKGSFVQRQFM